MVVRILYDPLVENSAMPLEGIRGQAMNMLVLYILGGTFGCSGTTTRPPAAHTCDLLGVRSDQIRWNRGFP